MWLLKNKFTKRALLLVGLLPLLFILTTSPVLAQTIGDRIVSVINTIFYGLLYGIVNILILAVGILIEIGKYPIDLDSGIVDTGWKVIRDISNMFFVVVLLLISFGTILRLDQYQIKSLLPKVVIMAILVNFSKLIAGFFIEISQIVLLTFAAAYQQTGAGNFMTAMQIPTLTQISSAGSGDTSALDRWDVFQALIGGIIYALIAVVVVVAYVVIFVMRLVALWILTVFSPFAFSLSVIPAGQKYASMWWEQFSKYLIVGPVLAFFLWLSLASLPAITNTSNVDKYEGKPRTADETAYLESVKKIPSAGVIKAYEPEVFLGFVLSSVMLIMSLYFAQQIGGTVGNIARKGISSLSTLGKNAGGLRPALRYWDERRAGAGKKSLNASVYWDAWKSQREETKRQRMTESIGYAQALAKQGYANAAAGYVKKGIFGSALKEGIDQDGEEIKRLGVMQTVGAGLDVASRQKKYKQEYDDAKRSFAAAKASKDELYKYTQMKLEVDQADGDIQAAFSNPTQREEYTKLNKIYGNLSTDVVIQEMNRVNEEYGKADVALTTAKANSELGEQELAGKLKAEAQAEINSLNAEISVIEDGNMGASEVKDAINKNSQEIKKFEDLIKRLATMGGSTEETEAANDKLDALRNKQSKLEGYQSEIEQGVKPTIGDDLAPLVASAMAIKDKTKKLSDLKLARELAQIKAEGKPLNDDELGRLKKEEEAVKTRQRNKRVELAKMELPLYYQEKARRSMVGEKLKELAGIEDSEELIQIFGKAEAEGDKYMQMAVANKLAGDGNHNDLLNHYGYGSGFEGFKEFYSQRITKNFGGDDKAKDAALRLARDVSYVAESRNHWDQARVVKVDPSGNMEWATEDEHVGMVMNEIKKLNPQKVKREFNRLAVGGEEILANGDVRFIWGKLAQSFLESQYDNIYDAAKPGGDLQKNLAENLLKGLNSLPYDQLVRDGFVQMQKRLDEFVNNPRLAEGKK